LSVSLTRLKRIIDDVSRFLRARKMFRDSVRLDGCYGWQHCHNAHCILCMSRRALRQRKHLEKELPAILSKDDTLQLWLITGTTADSLDVNLHAKAAVRGMVNLLKHPRLKGRVVTSFSVLEVAHKTSRVAPCAHVHTLLVCKPITSGKYRISEASWVEMWEECCSLPRVRQGKLPRKNKKKPKPNLSLDARIVGTETAGIIHRTEADLTRVIRYVTKWSYVKNIATDYRQLLVDPDAFMVRIKALKGVTRFFGKLHNKQKRLPEASLPRPPSRGETIPSRKRIGRPTR
jgi:hypothetical protein